MIQKECIKNNSCENNSYLFSLLSGDLLRCPRRHDKCLLHVLKQEYDDFVLECFEQVHWSHEELQGQCDYPSLEGH